MTTLTITAKGQITLKKELLHHLGLKPGDKLSVDMVPGKRLTVSPDTPRQQDTLEKAFGSLRREGQKPISIDEMNDVIAKGWAGELDK